MAMLHRVSWDPGFIGRSPWLWPIARAAERLRGCAVWPTLAEFDALYLAEADACGVPRLRFRYDAHPRRSRSTQPIVHEDLYDGSISLLGQVPTRPENWHDLLNALCFATWPRSKVALHARQYRLLAQRLTSDAVRLPPARLPAQDALTLFDEGGVLIAADRPAAQALRACLAAPLTDTLIPLIREQRAHVVPFGHALFEHMVEGIACPGATARIIAFDTQPPRGTALLHALDHALADKLGDPQEFLMPSKGRHLRLEDLAAP
jgi:hypothetical protein